MRPTNGQPRPAHHEPIAIVGMGCRFPGEVDSPRSFWRMLSGGLDGIGELPPGRWESYRAANPENASALRKTTTLGGFIADIDGFDAEFFGTTPREAGLMDPQQRMALEVSWEALEHAGIVPVDLAGSDTGVYMGVNTDDHGRRLLEDLPRIEAWTGVGSSLCIVANRVSYALDLRGPSLVVDTACSSSLVAIHLACQALAIGETPLAIAGGVMLMAGPGLTMVMDAAGALSPDGRSKSFDASADGYGRGEGCGVVVLKRLADAWRDGDRVLAVIRGTAVHQDGRTNGIMAPSGVAQEHLLRQAYRRAEVPPDTIDYVEAHGTGTPAGDPLEAGAMAAVFGAGRQTGAPCLIGSVKTNIGHLEAASGVAGVIKTVLALDAGEIPPTLNVTEPNPQIPWETSGLRVVTEQTPWPRTDHPRRAGVSGYGYGGTIAHVILEQAPDPADADKTTVDGTLRLYPLTGNSTAAVQAYAGRLADWLEGPGATTSLADVGHTLAHRRSHLDWRTTVVAAGRDELIARLRDVATENPTSTVSAAQVLDGATDPGVLWVFSGHGAQWVGMGRELLATEPVFGAVLDELASVFEAEAGYTPRQLLVDGDLHDTDRIQPAIYAMQVALAEVWRSYGVRPSAVVGHSVGEIAAAVVAGVYSRRDGARLICRRSALLRRVAGRGAMAMVNLSFDEVMTRLAGRSDVVAAIAASSTSTVVAGDVAAVEELARQWSSEGDVVVQRVASDVAFHSPHMDPLLDELATSVAELGAREPALPIYVTALDDPRARPTRDGRYWAANLRNPVRFADAVRAAIDDGYRVFLEVAAHPVVSYNIDEVLTAAGIEDACVAGSLRRGRAERETLLANLGKLYCRGVPIDWDRAAPNGTLAVLPPIAWRHKEYRPDAVARRASQVRAHNVDSHTLLGGGMTVRGTSTARLWQTHLDAASRPYPGDHPVHGVEIVPAAVLLNTFFAAAADGAAPPVLTDVVLRTPVTVTSARELQVLRQGNSVLRLSSRLLETETGAADPGSEDGWLTHTTAVARAVEETDWAGEHTLPVATLRERCADALDPGFVIDRLASIGVAAMGFPWRITELSRGDGELLATVAAQPQTSWASVLDAALSAASVVFDGPPILRMPAQIRQVAVAGPPPAEALISMRALDSDTVDVHIATLDGRVVARLSGLRYGVLDGDIGAPANPRRLVHELVWRKLESSEVTNDALRVVVIGDDTLAQPLTAAGVQTTAVNDPEELDGLDGSTAVLVSPPETADPVRAAWLLTRTAQRLSTVDERTRLWVVTRGVRDGTALGHAPLWGLGRIVAGEHPELWGGIVDLDGEDLAGCAEELLAILRSRPDEDVIALGQEGGPLASRLAPLEREPTRAPTHCRPDGTYLITGGLGALGIEVAHWLADRGARRLLLAGRHALPPRAQWDDVDDPGVAERIRAVRGLEAIGVTVQTIALDVTDRAMAAELLAPGALGLPPIRGIVHAAGALDSRMLRDVDEESLRTVMAPKVDGAMMLHELFPPGTVDFFVLFSSCGQLLGLPGQASYAAANAFLDALATRRGDAISFGWTSWRGLGMSTSSALIDEELAARGTADITATEAFRCWEYAERFDAARLAVLRILPDGPGIRRPALLHGLTVAEPAGQCGAAPAERPWAALSTGELHAYLVGEVCRQVAAEMKLAPDELDVRRALSEMGLDSVMTLIIRRRLERQFRLSLPATLLWNRPTVLAVADYLAELLSEEDEPAETAEAA